MTDIVARGLAKQAETVAADLAASYPRAVTTPPAAQTFAAAARAAGTKSGAAFDPTIYNADAPYAALLRAQADVYTAENVMKEGVMWTGPNAYNFAQADAFMNIANADGKQVRGHVLFYPVKASAWQTAGLNAGNWQELCDAYLQAVLTRPSLQTVTDWDVVNEIIAGDTGSDAAGYITGTPHIAAAGSGDAFLQWAFNRADHYAPNTRLFYCDSNVEYANDPYHNVKRANLIGALTRAKDAGCRIDGYSMQCHLRADPYNNDYRADRQLLRNLCKALINLGLVINITEIDAQYPPATGWTGTNAEWDRRAKEFIYQVGDTILDATAGTASFPSHVSFWGLSDKYTSWANNPNPQRSHPFDSALNPKPMFTGILQALGAYAK